MKASGGDRRRRCKRIVMVFVLVFCLGGATAIYQNSKDAPVDTPGILSPLMTTSQGDSKLEAPREPNRNLPARLFIPRLKVDAAVVYMGLTKSDSMDVPTNIADAGWYKNGPLPGNKGSAVIAGHVNGPKGQPGVFAELTKLQVGDEVKVIDLNGLSTTFTVRMSKTYAQNDQPDEVFHSSEGAHLNLITCVGAWDQTARQYSQRLVVFTDKE